MSALAAEPPEQNWRAERDEAMAKVERGTDPAWALAAERAFVWVAQTSVTFTTDDVWYELRNRDIKMPREPRALGPITQRMIRENLIETTGDYRKSRRRHGAPIPVYRKTQW